MATPFVKTGERLGYIRFEGGGRPGGGETNGDGVVLGGVLIAAKNPSLSFTPVDMLLKSHPEKISASAMIDLKPLWIVVPMFPTLWGKK